MKKVAILLCICLALTIATAGCAGAPAAAPAASAASSAPAASASATAAPSAAPASSAPAADKVSLTVALWGIETDPIDIAFKDAIEQFNQSNTVNAAITYSFTDSEQYKTKIAAQMAGNEAPDVFMTWAAGFLEPFVKAGKVFSLSDALDKDPEWAGRYIKGINSNLTFDGKVYAVATTQTPVALFYNTEIFQKYNLTPPATYEDLKKVIATLNQNGVTPFAFGNKAAWVGGMWSMVVANRIGGSEPYNKVFAGTGTWEDPSFIKAGQIMAELVKLKAFPDGFNALDTDPANLLFKTGKAGMLVMGSWEIQGFSAADSTVKGKVGVAKFPSFEGGAGSIDNWLMQPDLNLAISESCQNKDAALAFLKTISSPEFQGKLAELGNLVTTNITPDAAKVDPCLLQLTQLQKDMKEGFIFYDVGFGATIGNEYNSEIQAITAGRAPEEAFKKLQQFTEQNR